ncbi:MAG: M23 family metallopeptidase [Desulfovibrionaceae bacterium]|nr:M23 family metallopeptidase [Desulfovibrionaceae bacterium]
MPFGKYHVVIFKERSGSSRSLRLRGWLGVAVCLVFCLLVAGNVWLSRYYVQARTLETRLFEAERSLDEHQSQLMSMVGQLTSVRSDLQRVQSFDTKLRLMMDIDVGVADLSMGGASSEDLNLSSLPLHRQEMASRKIRLFLQELSDEIRLEEVQQQELLLAMRDNHDRLAVMPSIWPVEGFVSSGFGTRSSPFTGRPQSHKGLDIAARMGTPIHAPARGVVSMAGTDGAYGISVELGHGGGLTTKYGHMSKLAVKAGQTVERGEVIGYVGRSGRATGPHLHYEVRLNGVPTNPYAYLLN